RAEERALVVIRERGIDRVLVGAILLDPSIEACFFGAHLEATGRVLQTLYAARQQVEKVFIGDQSGAAEQDVLIVARDAFGDPEQARVVLLRIVEGAERVGADAFDVPSVEEFVRDNREDVAITRFGLETETRDDDRRRVQMFKPAPARRAQAQEKSVIVIRQL